PMNERDMPVADSMALVFRQVPMRLNRDVAQLQRLGSKRLEFFVGYIGWKTRNGANAGTAHRPELLDKRHAWDPQCKKQARCASSRLGLPRGEVARSSIEWRGDDSFFNS